MILGCSGPALGPAEGHFFADADPLGFILFERNCVAPDQVRDLVGALRAAVGRPDAPVLIDQEGGRIARLKPPHWRASPPAAAFARLARRDRGRAASAARLNARLIAGELACLGISVNCAPVLDVPQPGAASIIGDRAAGDTPELSAVLGEAVCEGFLEGGILPVLKHIPGHGRAMLDSHQALPVVDAPVAELEAVDFAPFRALNRMPMAMTAHVVYAAIDPSAPATTSATVIETAIRGAIGFRGLLLSDDLSMRALRGSMGGRARAALAAGCDVVLHCNGDRAEMEAVVSATGRLAAPAQERLGRALAMRRPAAAFDAEAAAARLERYFQREEAG